MAQRDDAMWWVMLLGGGAAVAWFLVDEKSAHASTSPMLPPARDPEGRVIVESATATYPTYDQVDDVTAVGRILRSEVGNGPLDELVAIAWVARNRAKARGVSIRRLVCWPQCGPGGKGPTGSRPFSTRLAPSARGLDVARTVLAAPQSQDPTKGAIAAFEPALQDKLFAEKRPGYNYDAEGIRTRWAADGLVKFGTVGRWELLGRTTTKAASTSTGPITSPSQIPSTGPVTSPSQVP